MPDGKIKRMACMVLAPVLALGIFTGCNNRAAESEAPLPEVSSPAETPGGYRADDVFSLNCNREYSLNPMTTPNANNILCTQLMYDNIYEVDSSFEVSSRIIKEAKTEEGIYWYFTVDTSVKFWDGTKLTAWDVAYSIQRAQQSSRLKGRVSGIAGCNAQSDTQFAITMYSADANTQLPALLTIPVIKDGSIEEAAPLGTGPYMPDEGFTKLTLFTGHKDASSMPFDAVYLKEVLETDAAIAAYENSELDLVANDPTGMLNLGYGSANDARYYPTTNMHYLGFNSRSDFFSNELCRHAMTYVVNRERIVNDILGGAAVEAAMPINPASALYNASYSEMIAYSVKKSEEAFDAAEVSDFDDDGLREIMITGIPVEIENYNLVFIVANDNAQKVAAAQTIADNLTDLGITITLKAMPWSEYKAALAAGNFDMYYAEAMLTADFNPGVLMASGGALNYGGFNDPLLEEKINDYMSAGDGARKMAADLMNKYITDSAPIVTICFERHQVITHRGVVSGMKPSQYNVFQNLSEWTVELG